MSEDSSERYITISFHVKTSNLVEYEKAAQMMHARGILPRPDVNLIAYYGFKNLLREFVKQEEDLQKRIRIKPHSVRDDLTSQLDKQNIRYPRVGEF